MTHDFLAILKNDKRNPYQKKLVAISKFTIENYFNNDANGNIEI